MNVDLSKIFDMLIKNNKMLQTIEKKKTSNETIMLLNEYIVTFFNYIFTNELNKSEINKIDNLQGKLLEEEIVHNKIKRSYLMYVPKSYDGKDKVPLLLNFHGYGGQARTFMRTADMREIAEEKKFILIYPQGSLDKQGFPHWNSGLKSKDNKSDAEDIDFVNTIIDNILKKYYVDDKRVYVSGYSNGSFMAYSLGCYLSNKIAGVASVAGSMMVETYNNCKPTHPMAMINIHGLKDNVVPYDGNEGTISVDKIMDYWGSYNKTEKKALITFNEDKSIEHIKYENGTNDISIEHYKIIDGGHNWDDEIYFNKMNTSEIVCNYLLQYNIDGLINKETKMLKEEPKMCCMAMTKSCLACSKGVTEEEFCKDNPGKYGCDTPKKTVCSENILNNINDCLSLLTIKLEMYEKMNKLDNLLLKNDLHFIDKLFINVMFMNRWGMDKTLLKKTKYTEKEMKDWTLEETLKSWKLNLDYYLNNSGEKRKYKYI